MKEIGKIEFKTELVLERSITPLIESLGMADNTMILYVEGESGGIEWEYTLSDGDGDTVGIGLWFEKDGKTLCDYDGVFSLSVHAIELLEKYGYNADYAKE